MSLKTNIIPDVLAHRYASQEMCQLWSPQGKYLLEREFWIAVMKAQRDLGVDIPQEAIQAYELVKGKIDIPSIENRERILKHDVKARLEEFCELAGHQHIHKGMTSRDLTDNVEQLQIYNSLKLISNKYATILHHMSAWSLRYQETIIVGRTHNVPAQPTTLGKRIAMFGQEMLLAFRRLEHQLTNYPIRGIQGAVGTQLDQWVLLNNSSESVRELSQKVRHYLGFTHTLNAVGQVYPRSLDYEVVSCLYLLSSGIANFAKTLRLMAGHELATEGFQMGQVGSSAMPHKTNMRSSERINGFHQILNGYVNMLMGLAGDQWNEGDVADSIVRRVALPGAMFAMDGQLDTMLTILKEMGFYEAMIEQELSKYLPFLATTTILMESVRRGIGREFAHEIIKEHAVATANDMRNQPHQINDLPERLAADERLPLNKKEIHDILQDTNRYLASASTQVNIFVHEVKKIVQRYPHAQIYQPPSIV